MHAGFRAGYSAIDNIFCLQSMIRKYLSQRNGRFYVLYIDSRTALDYSLNDNEVFHCLRKKGKATCIPNMSIAT